MSARRGGQTRKPAGGSRIHQGFVGARALIGTAYLADAGLRAEYARDIAPRTGAALAKILREIFPRPPGPGQPRRVLDLGAGTGAAGAAVRAHFPEAMPDVVAVDRTALGPAVRSADVTDPAALRRAVAAESQFDLLVAAHLLNELYLEEPAEVRALKISTLVGRWCELLLNVHGTVILLEPALRDTSRVLLQVRDHLLAAGLHVVAPCFFTGPCPALLRERDWCHDAAPPKTAVVQPFTARDGMGGDRSAPGEPSAQADHPIDFSYLVLRLSSEPANDPTLFRIVSDPLPEKGRLKLYACGLSGRHPIVRLDRHASASNDELEEVQRGDVIRLSRTTFAQDGLRVGADTEATRPAVPATGDPPPR